MANPSIALLYICTGKYHVFWQDFYRSAERFLFPGSEKRYFVFTDFKGKLDGMETGRVHITFQQSLGWPGNTLYRYRMFRTVAEELLKTDYTYFFNANVEFLRPVPSAFLPTKEEPLVAVRHVGFANATQEQMPFEENPESTAYLPLEYRKNYVLGGINGGLSQEFVKVIIKLAGQIEVDDANGIVARWHDESHWNHLVSSNGVRTLGLEFGSPEGPNAIADAVISIRDKGRFGGHAFLRGERGLNKRIREIGKRVFNKLGKLLGIRK